MSRYVLFLALAVSLVAFLVVTGLVLSSSSLKPYGIFMAATMTFVFSLLFALRWPAYSWRWGVWLSAGFWVYFGVVFLAYLVNGSVAWQPAIYALVVLVLSCLAGVLGGRFSRKASPTA